MTSDSPRLERAASVVLRIGAVLVVVAALPFRTFELDRFFVPKELVLHATAAVVLILLLDRVSRSHFGRTDLLLGAFLGLSTIATALATNHWLATRALSVTASGLALFWGARTIARAGLGRSLLGGLAAAVLVGALTGLAQAYGLMGDVLGDFLSLARAPGGTFGNRNFLAHLCAIGIPTVLYLALSARVWPGTALGGATLALLSAAVLLSRTRAAWLALIFAAVVLLPAAFWRRSLLRASPVPLRAAALSACIALGVMAALLLPNALSWRSDNPYLESATGVVNYREGSGRGRLVQYENSLQMALAHPLVGVGPGNWPVGYPDHASRRDPSLGPDGMTMNPWPSSDWVAFVSERGFPAAVALVAAFVALLVAGVQGLRRAQSPEEVAAALALCGTVIVTGIVGAFDAVLLLPAPSLVAWSLLGALCVACARQEVRWSPAPRTGRRHALMAAVGTLGAVLVLRSVSMALAMGLADGRPSAAALQRAARADPGSYRIRVAAAEALARRGQCRAAREHAVAAREQFPDAAAPRRILARCR